MKHSARTTALSGILALLIFLLPSFPSMARAAPAGPFGDVAPRQDAGGDVSYQLSVYAPNHADLHGQRLHARGQGLFIGLSGPSTYCPSNVERSGGCPPGTDTLVVGQMAGMAVTVPGGQALYIPPDGAVGYTQAHSASTPPDSVDSGWYNITLVSDCAPTVEVVSWCAPPGVDDRKNGTGPGQGVYICRGYHYVPDYVAEAGGLGRLAVGRYNLTDYEECTRVEGIVQTGVPVSAGAWQYT